MEAKRRAEGKVPVRASRLNEAGPATSGAALIADAVGNGAIKPMDLSHLTPGPDLKPRSPGLDPDQGWCKRCGEMTDQWYQRTLDQARVRLCKRCKRESEAELVI